MPPDDIAATVATILRDPLAGMNGGIGYVGVDLPLELFVATGRPFGHLPWQPERPTDWADRWLESGFPGWTRSILEDWHDGRFDGLSRVVFSRADDASQRLYYYVRELQQRGQLAGPRAQVFDIALLPREASLAHTAQVLRRLAEDLNVDEAGVRSALPRVNTLRRRLAELQAARRHDGPLHERLSRAALFSDATRWLSGGPASPQSMHVPPAPDSGRPRVLLAGSVPPDERLHHAVEEAGGSVTGEAHALGLHRLGDPFEIGEESAWRALARHLRLWSVAPRAVIDRAAWIVEQARRSRAAGVVLWLTREEESLAWHVPAQRAALQAAGLPCLALTARRWQADDGATGEIAAFCRENLR